MMIYKLSNNLITFSARNILFNKNLANHKFQNGLVLKANKSQITAALQCGTAATIIGLMKFYSKFKQGKKTENVNKEVPKDTVIIYQFPRAANTPSLSPFAMRLESWCRMADLKYQNELSMKRGEKGLIPFIKLNGFVVDDSQMCIDYLSKVFQKDLNAHLTPEQKALSFTVTSFIEDKLKWCIVLHRFWHSNKGLKETGLPKLAYWYFSYRVFTAGWYSGYGRLSKEELYDIGKNCLTSLNTLIGDKKYFFGNKQPSEIDATIFGMCVQIKYNDLGPLNHFLKTECHNIIRHIDNFQQTFWPDWDKNTQVGRRKLKALAAVDAAKN